MLSPSQIQQTLAGLKPELMKKYHVSKIGYFGSYAKGTADEQSDIDILVEFSKTPGWDFF